jgi:hypothetical protein
MFIIYFFRVKASSVILNYPNDAVAVAFHCNFYSIIRGATPADNRFFIWKPERFKARGDK